MEIPPSGLAARGSAPVPTAADAIPVVPGQTVEAVVTAVRPRVAATTGFLLDLSVPGFDGSLEASSDRALEPGSRIALRFVDSGMARVERIIENPRSPLAPAPAQQALREALPLQQPLADALRGLSRALAVPTLPDEVRREVERLLNNLPSAATVSTASGLRSAIATSGTFLEAHLRRTEPAKLRPASPPATQKPPDEPLVSGNAPRERAPMPEGVAARLARFLRLGNPQQPAGRPLPAGSSAASSPPDARAAPTATMTTAGPLSRGAAAGAASLQPDAVAAHAAGSPRERPPGAPSSGRSLPGTLPPGSAPGTGAETVRPTNPAPFPEGRPLASAPTPTLPMPASPEPGRAAPPRANDAAMLPRQTVPGVPLSAPTQSPAPTPASAVPPAHTTPDTGSAQTPLPPARMAGAHASRGDGAAQGLTTAPGLPGRTQVAGPASSSIAGGTLSQPPAEPAPTAEPVPGNRQHTPAAGASTGIPAAAKAGVPGPVASPGGADIRSAPAPAVPGTPPPSEARPSVGNVGTPAMATGFRAPPATTLQGGIDDPSPTAPPPGDITRGVRPAVPPQTAPARPDATGKAMSIPPVPHEGAANAGTDTDPLQADLKASLARVRGALLQILARGSSVPREEKLNPILPQAEGTETEPLYNARGLFNAAVTRRTGSGPAGARQPVGSIAGPAQEESLEQLLRVVESALARTRVHQLAGLHDPRGATDITAPLWSVELPIPAPGGFDSLWLRLEESGDRRQAQSEGAPSWSVMLCLDCASLGPIHALVRLSGQQLLATLWAEREDTLLAARAAIADLEDALRAQGVDVERVECLHGRPAEAAGLRFGNLLDVRT